MSNHQSGTPLDMWVSRDPGATAGNTAPTAGVAAKPADGGSSTVDTPQGPCAVALTENQQAEPAEATAAGVVPGEKQTVRSSIETTLSSEGKFSNPADSETVISKIKPEPYPAAFTSRVEAELPGAPFAPAISVEQNLGRVSSKTAVTGDNGTAIPADVGAIPLNAGPVSYVMAIIPLTHTGPPVPRSSGSIPGKEEPGSVSPRTIMCSDGSAGKPAGVNTDTVGERAAAVTDKPHFETTEAPHAVIVPDREQPRDPEKVQLVPTPTAVAKQESPMAVRKAISTEITKTKTSKRGPSEKRGHRREPLKETTKKSPKKNQSPKSLVSIQSHKGIPVTSATTRGPVRPAASAVTSAAAGFRLPRDETAAAATVQPSKTRQAEEQQGPRDPVSLGATAGARPTDYQVGEAASPRAGINVRPSRIACGHNSATEAATKRKKTAADILASMADLENNLEKIRMTETDPNKLPGLFKIAACFHAKKETWITLAFFGACVLLIFFVFYLSDIRKQPKTGHAFCHTEDCQLHASRLTKLLNSALDPCEDYAAFVCSSWEPSKAHMELARSSIDDLRFTWYDHFLDTLTKGSLKISAARKPLAMYDMCRTKYPHSASQMALVKDFFLQHGLRWPQSPANLQSPLGMFVGFGYRWRMPLWITVNVRHHKASGKRHVFLSPGLYLPILLNHLRSVSPFYAKYWQQFLLIFYPDIANRPPMNEKAINKIRIMEEDIITTLYQVGKKSRKRPALFSFRDIGARVRNASATDWVRDFQDGLLLQPSLTADDQIIVTDVALLETVANLLVTYSRLELNKHVTWLIVQYFTVAGDYSVLVRYYGSHEKAEKYLPIYCAHHVEAVFKVLVSALGFFSRLTVQDRKIIDDGFESLISAAVDKVNNTSWIDDESKWRVRDKFRSMKKLIWPSASLLSNHTLEKIYAHFPEKERSYADFWFKGRSAASQVTMTEGYDEALMLLGNYFPDYASYDYVYNIVVLAMGAAAPPAFYRNGTKAMLYGGLFFFMAMKLVSAIDAEGIKWSSNITAYEDTILSSSTLKEFTAREGCEHSSIFPDIPALEIAYAALMASERRDTDGPIGINPDLPEKKVFFMTLCYMTCASPGAQNAIASDCNKVVRNSKAFAEVYGCPKGSKMNPEKKCLFFS